MAQLSQKVLINGDEYELKGNVDFSNLTIKLIGVDNPDPEVPPVVTPPTDPTKPTEGTVKEGGWGANLEDKNAWKVVNMKDFPEQFKIVDAAGKNVATNFKTKEVAENFIAYFKTHPFPPEDTTQPPNPPDPNPQPGTNGDGPYPQKVGSKTLQSTQRGPTTRHYASGKPDDETIEKNVKDISYRNYQFIIETTIKEMEHDDNISLKFGGQHTSGNGWWDTGVGIYDGQTCLGTEPDHPETHLCLVKGPKIGDIRNKRIKIAGVFFEQNDHIELWTNLEGKGWVKQVEGDHVGNLKPDHSKGHECQERIDGFAKGSVPELHFAVVQEIDPKGSVVPTPPPIEPPITPPVTPPIEPPVEPPITPPVTPPPAGSGVTRDGVKIPYETTGKFEYIFRHNDRDDGKRMDFNNLKADEYVNAVVLGYFAFPQDNAPDDEVSGKFSAMPHSGSNRTECFDMGTGIKDGATRIRYEAKHPDYTGDLGNGEKGLPLKTKYIGYMYARKNLPNGNVLCEQWQDQGDNEGSIPANKWVKLFSWEDPKYQFKDYKDGHGVTIRVDGNNVVKDMKLKWLALVEIK